MITLPHEGVKKVISKSEFVVNVILAFITLCCNFLFNCVCTLFCAYSSLAPAGLSVCKKYTGK